MLQTPVGTVTETVRMRNIEHAVGFSQKGYQSFGEWPALSQRAFLSAQTPFTLC